MNCTIRRSIPPRTHFSPEFKRTRRWMTLLAIAGFLATLLGPRPREARADHPLIVLLAEAAVGAAVGAGTAWALSELTGEGDGEATTTTVTVTTNEDGSTTTEVKVTPSNKQKGMPVSTTTIVMPTDLGVVVPPTYTMSETHLVDVYNDDSPLGWSVVNRYANMHYEADVLSPAWPGDVVGFEVSRDTKFRFVRPPGTPEAADIRIPLDIASFQLSTDDIPNTMGRTQWDLVVECEELGVLFESHVTVRQGTLPLIEGDIPATQFQLAPGTAALMGPYTDEVIVPVPMGLNQVTMHVKYRLSGRGEKTTLHSGFPHRALQNTQLAGGGAGLQVQDAGPGPAGVVLDPGITNYWGGRFPAPTNGNPAPPGSWLEMTAETTGDGLCGPQQSRLRMQEQQGRYDVIPQFLFGVGAQYEMTAFNQGQEVFQDGGRSGSAFSFDPSDIPLPVGIWFYSCIKKNPDGTYSAEMCLIFVGDFGTETSEPIEIDVPGKTAVVADAVRLRQTVPAAASTLGRIAIGFDGLPQLVVAEESVLEFDQLFGGLGQAEMLVNPDDIFVRNIGSSGLDGVRMILENSSTSAALQFDPLGLPGQYPAGAYVQLASMGNLVGGSEGLLGTLRVEDLGSYVHVTGDYSPIGSSTARVLVFDENGTVVDDLAGVPLSNVAEVNRHPQACGKEEVTLPLGPATLCFWVDFGPGTIFDFPGAPQKRMTVGSRIAVLAEGSGALEELDTFELRARSIGKIRIRGTAAPTPTAAPPALDTSRLSARLLPASPNPFNPRTSVSFELDRPGPAQVRIYGVDGRLVRTLLHRWLPAGSTSVNWDGRDESARSVASGTYLVRLVSGDITASQKVTLAK